jgi:hypothetical protein
MFHERDGGDGNRDLISKSNGSFSFWGRASVGGQLPGHVWIRSQVSFFSGAKVRATRLVDSHFAHTVDHSRDGRRAGSSSEHASSAIFSAVTDERHRNEYDFAVGRLGHSLEGFELTDLHCGFGTE